MELGTRVWNTFISSTMGFVAFLEGPPAMLAKLAAKLLRKASHGPTNLFRHEIVTVKRHLEATANPRTSAQ